MSYNKRYESILIYTTIIILSCLFQNCKCQKIEEIKIGDTIKGTMELDESHRYFKLVIPKNETGRVLIFTTHEDSQMYSSSSSDTEFSDPDFYISKKNKYPSSQKSSEWFSEQYGSDILAVPSEQVNADDIFFVGLYCQYKCKYYLNIHTDKETEAKLNRFQFVRLRPKETINYKIKMSDEEYDELKVIAMSRTAGRFRMFMSKNSPSSSNTFKIIPSWNKGYVISVKRGTSDYCINCEYHVIIQNDDEEKTNIILMRAKISEKFVNLTQNVQFHDALAKFSMRCYNFKLKAEEKTKEKLIIQITAYSGDATLLIEGWEPKNIKTRREALNSPNAYNVFMEKFTILSPKDFRKFDEENPQYAGKDSALHFCIYSDKEVSYIIEGYYLSKLQNLRHNPLLMPGNTIRGYLMKNQVIKYNLIGDNSEKMQYKIETNLTVTTTKVVGKTNLYGYFCQDERCSIDKDKINNLKESNSLISADSSDESQAILSIPYSQNICYKNPIIKKSDTGNEVECSTEIIVSCESTGEGEDNNTDLCIYDIQLNVKDVPLLMKQKQIYEGKISFGKTDTYEILISDPNVESLVVVLNSESGDAQLSLYQLKGTVYDMQNLISVSSHNDYIPDVVRITANKINQENLIGKFLAKVTPATFSTYKIYYYFVYKKNFNANGDENNQAEISPEVTMNLNLGEIISDYFPNDIRYKIYSLIPLFTNKETIKIFLNRVNIDFRIYVYTDISKFKILQFYQIRQNPSLEEISGYQWKSNTNNEVIISASDPEYKQNKILYVVISPAKKRRSRDDSIENYNFNTNTFVAPESNNDKDDTPENLNKKSVSKFYLGVAYEKSALVLSEGMPHTMTLSNSYTSQKYHHRHTDFKKNFDLILNVFLGEVDIFVDIKHFNLDDVGKIDNAKITYDPITQIYTSGTLKYKLNVKNSAYISLDSSFISENINNAPGAHIYYYIRRSSISVIKNEVCQYFIVEKTISNKGQLLQPGVITTSKIKEGDKQYFIVEEIQKRHGAIINVIFKEGSGSVYVRIPQVPESPESIRFPTEALYDFKGYSLYSGKVIQLPDSVFDKLNENNIKLQILITVRADTSSEVDDPNKKGKNAIEFSISYSNEIKRLNQNEPYRGFVKQGQLQYFGLYFDKNTENIYIGISNMGNGDADMYLNKGEKLPTIQNYDWCSADNTHEYIDISKSDYVSYMKNYEDLSGFYTLLIVGFLDTPYTLFISTHEKLVMPLIDNTPMTCFCMDKGESCYFRYNKVFRKDIKADELTRRELIFTSEYLYGSGMMYAKIVKDSDLYANQSQFYEIFPDEENYDMSNKESHQKNYMKIFIDAERYEQDSTILMTFTCNEKTKVDITATELRHYSGVDYLYDNRENTYYLGNDKNDSLAKITLIASNYLKEKDLIYTIHSYVGNAKVKVYSNVSRWDVTSQKNINNYNLIHEFLVYSDNENEDNIDLYNPYTNEYHNYISVKDKEKYDDIYFAIEPLTEFGFFIEINFDKEWVNLPIGKSKSFYVTNQELFGYFDITEEYTDVEFSLSVENNLKMYAEVFIKINTIDKSEKLQIKDKNINKFNLYHYSFPREDNYDLKSVTDKTLGKLSINLNQLPKVDNPDIIVRGLFYVKVGARQFESIQEVNTNDGNANNNNFNNNNNENNNNENNNNNNRENDKKTLVNILITPGIDNKKFVEAKQYEYYFSNLTYNKDDINPLESKTYSLTRENLNHDVMVIEINRCYGEYEISINEEFDTKNSNSEQKSSLEIERKDYKGREVYYVYNLNSKHYYLTMTSKMSKFRCVFYRRRHRKKDGDIGLCGNNLSYLMYYYTTFSENVDNDISGNDYYIIHHPYGPGRVKLDLPLVITDEVNQNIKEIKDYKFDVYATNKQSYYESMGNLCVLSRATNDKESIYKLDNIYVENKNSIIITGLNPKEKYYINVLAQNTKTKQIIIFYPFALDFGHGPRMHPPFEGYFLLMFLSILVSLLIFFIYKYNKAKDELIMIKGETVPKTEYELSSVTASSHDKIRYSGLSDSY